MDAHAEALRSSRQAAASKIWSRQATTTAPRYVPWRAASGAKRSLP